MKEIIITCDECKKIIKKGFGHITVSSIICEILLEMHFCTDNCMKSYLMNKWNERDQL